MESLYVIVMTTVDERYELRRTVQPIELSIAQLIDRDLWTVQYDLSQTVHCDAV